MIGKIIKGIDYLVAEINKSVLYKNLDDYCFLESASDQTTFVGEDGSLASIIKIKGNSKTILSDERMYEMVERLYMQLKVMFANEGHMLQMYFCRDSSQSEAVLQEHYKPYRQVAKDLGMDMDFYFDEKINKLKNYIVHEENYMVLWTRPSVQKNKEEEVSKSREDMKKAPLFEKAADTFRVYKSIQQKHISYVDTMLRVLKSLGIYTNLLGIKSASNAIKRTSDIGRVGDWSPRVHIPNEENKPVMKTVNDENIKADDISYYLYPKLKRQLVPSAIMRDDDSIIVNGKYIKTFFVEIPQEDVSKFSDFLANIDDSISFQISFKMEGGGLNKIGFKNFLAKMLTFDPLSDNRLIKDSINYYKEMAKKEGAVFTKSNISINVWADDKERLNRNANLISSELQAWGSCTVVEDTADNYEGFFNVLPAITPKIPSQCGYIVPLEETLFNLPLNRMLNLDDKALITYRTHDKKMINYNPMSSYFNYFNELIVATPGSGKSVKSNVNNLSFIFQKKLSANLRDKIPLIFIIDIGPSSKGFISFLRSVAPAKMKNLFYYHKVENDKEQSINVLDTPLGCRLPPEKIRGLLTSFISMLTTPVGEKPIDDMMINKLLIKTYQKFSDRGSNVRTIGNIEEVRELQPEIYDGIMRYGMKVNPKTKWWSLVDAFFQKNELSLARKAQVEAVPTLIDLIGVLKTEDEFKEMYPEAEITQFVRFLSSSLDLYPLFNGKTKIDLTDARVLSFDLNDVAPDGKGDETAAKKSALMYTFSTIYGLRNFFYEENTKKSAPDMYAEYLDGLYKEYRAIPKRFVVDEFHRGAQIKKFKSEVIRILRESRKWNMSNCLISQYLDDFDGAIRALCSSRFILSAGDKYKSFKEAFDFDDDISEILRTRLTGGSSIGLPFVVDYETKEGRFTQYLYSTLSGMELWSTTSTSEDVELFNQLERVFGVRKAITILAHEYPKGSIKDLLDNDSTGKLSIQSMVDRLKDKYT